MTGNERTEAHLERWNDVFESRDWGRYPPEELIRFVARNFGDVPERGEVRFLEVGCGPGANIWFLRREGLAFGGIVSGVVLYGVAGSMTGCLGAEHFAEKYAAGFQHAVDFGDA